MGCDGVFQERDRLLDGAIAAKFLAAVLALPRVKGLISSDYFSVDGTLIEAWASMKSFKPKDGSGDEPPSARGRNAEVDFKGEKRSNETHASTTDPEARLYRKGPGMEAKLAFLGHALMENRCGLIVDACLTPASGHGERIAALAMIEPRADRPTAITLGADKGYDAADFVNELRVRNVRPHILQNTSGRRSAIDRRTTRHPGYSASQRVRKRIEEAFGWLNRGRAAQDEISRRRSRWLGFRLRRRCLQSGAAAEIDRRNGRMMRHQRSMRRAHTHPALAAGRSSLKNRQLNARPEQNNFSAAC